MKNILNGKILLAVVLIAVVLIGHVILISIFLPDKKTTQEPDNQSGEGNLDSSLVTSSQPQVLPVNNNDTKKENPLVVGPIVTPPTAVKNDSDKINENTGTEITTAPTTSRSKDLVIPGAKDDKVVKNEVGSVTGVKSDGKKDLPPKPRDVVVIRPVKLVGSYPSNSLQKRFPATNPGVNFDYSTAVSNFAGSKTAKAGILVDLETRRVLWAKNAQSAYGIASMTKMMTTLLVMEQLAADRTKNLNSNVKVSKSAARFSARQRGGIIWLDSRESFTIDNLLKAMLIKSANDVAYLVGEYFGKGDIKKFIEQMNFRSKELGFASSRYVNTHGLTEYRNRRANYNKSSAEDQARLAELLLQYPEVVNIIAMRSFKLPRKVGKNKYTLLANTNKLLSKKSGIIGMKTGFTNAAGWCLTSVCHKNNKTLVGVVMGMPSSKQRNKFMKNLLEWGMKKVSKK